MLRCRGLPTFDVSMDFSLVVQVFKAKQQFPANDGDMSFTETTGFELEMEKYELNEYSSSILPTKSKHDPPARYSMTVEMIVSEINAFATV